MGYVDLFLLVSSACLYGFSALFTPWFWWSIIFFPVPFLYVATKQSIGFKEGYVWGLIIFSLHLHGVLLGIIDMAGSSLPYKYAPAIFIILFQALFPAFFFWGTSFIIKSYTITSLLLRTLLWTATLWLLAIWIDGYCLFPFLRCEGYSLMNPLLPLATHPRLLFLLPIVGKKIMILLFFMIPAMGFMALYTRRSLYFILFILFLAPWFFSFAFRSNTFLMPEGIDSVVHVPLSFSVFDNIWNTTAIISSELKEVVKNRPHAQIIVMPESAIGSPYIMNDPELCRYMNKESIGKELYLLGGAFRWDEHYLRNSFFVLYDGELLTYFDKRHTMVLTESLPRWMTLDCIYNLYYMHLPPRTPSLNKRPCITLASGISFVPYICSELFFNDEADDDYRDTLIIAIANDSWTTFRYIKNLMRLHVITKAIQWQRSILFASFNYFFLVDRAGNLQDL
jgi:apolipoprotein N-acyltransferase